MIDNCSSGGHQKVDQKLGRDETINFNYATCHKTYFAHNNYKLWGKLINEI
jgi:hypothetical protein